MGKIQDRTQWDLQAEKARKANPLKVLKHSPIMEQITPDTAKNLKWKSFKWMLAKDSEWKILRGFFKRPFSYGFNYLRSLFLKKPFKQEGDLFFYGIDSEEEFKQLLMTPDRMFVLGFSYCHKPFECPSGRFTDKCIHDINNNVCQQCFIGKCMHFAPKEGTYPLFIPTVHYVSEKILELMHKYPKRRLVFLITACELTLKMFADWGNMAKIKGIGVRLSGRICNTMKAFELSEQGIKPGLTTVEKPIQEKMLDILQNS